jgi:hypothetical protein
MESRMAAPGFPLKRQIGFGICDFRRGCLKLMKHQIAINSDARFIAL